ncbi:hypothetical protein ABIE12_003072 [Serratia sp. 509]
MDFIKNKFFILLFFIGLGDCDDVQERAFSGYVLGGCELVSRWMSRL